MLTVPWHIFNEFEILIMDLAYQYKINSKTDLEWFSDKLHTEIETALEDYAEGAGVTDYEPSY